jgi:hypothetical protein
MRKFGLFIIVLTLILGNTCHVQADLIDFESIPGIGTPTDGLSIGTQFQTTYGISFSLEGGGLPVIAQVGYPETAFTPGDTPLPGQGVGEFFLTDDTVVEGVPEPLIISYDTPTSATSGYILDIGGEHTPYPEIFTIEARDNIGVVLESLTFTAGDPGTGDELATLWSFNHATADIYSIRIVASRGGGRNVGWGFDNFNTNAVPTPSAIFLGILGIGTVGVKLRRKMMG